MSPKTLTALPVFNERHHLGEVLPKVIEQSEAVLVVDDGSTDGTSEALARYDVRVIRHPKNRGYGAALRTAFQFAARRHFETVITIDCDGQHEPQRIPQFAAACRGVDVVSGSRYLTQFSGDSLPPPERQWINMRLTADLNRLLGLHLTDAFCGFKAYRVESLKRLRLKEDGYAQPLEFWAQAAVCGLRIVEHPVPLIYLEEKRSFGGSLDDAKTRLAHYYRVLRESLADVGVPSRIDAQGRPQVSVHFSETDLFLKAEVV